MIIKEKQFRLTTIDNPFDPFDQFIQWDLFDKEKGYNSSCYLARIAKLSNNFSDEEYQNEIERAIDEIIKYDFMGIYKKLEREVEIEVDIDVE